MDKRQAPSVDWSRRVHQYGIQVWSAARSTPEKVTEELSKVVSAFANTEGGLLIIGIAEETRGKLRVASQIDGILAADWPTHRLQQLIESNVHPPLMGLRIYAVQLLHPNDRVAFIVEVPQGRTAHQAKDFRYYGRSELETSRCAILTFGSEWNAVRHLTLPLPFPSATGVQQKNSHQNQIENYRKQLEGLRADLLERGIDLNSPSVDNASPVVEVSRNLGADKPHLMDTEHLSSRFRCTEYDVEFVLTNSGERTIRDIEVKITTRAAQGCAITDMENAQPDEGFWSKNDIMKFDKTEIRTTLRDCLRTGSRKLWSGSTITVGRAIVLIPESGEAAPGAANATWTIFLDDMLPISGECDIGAHIANANMI